MQFEQYLTRACEEGFKVGRQPVGTGMIQGVVAPDLAFNSTIDTRLMRRLWRSATNFKLTRPPAVHTFHARPHLSQEVWPLFWRNRQDALAAIHFGGILPGLREIRTDKRPFSPLMFRLRLMLKRLGS